MDSGYPHDGRAVNAAYQHDHRVDNAAYPHDRKSFVSFEFMHIMHFINPIMLLTHKQAIFMQEILLTLKLAYLLKSVIL